MRLLGHITVVIIIRRNLDVGRDTREACVPRRDHVQIQREDGCLKGKKRSLRRKQGCQHLDPRFLASRTMRNQISVF